MFAPLHSVVMLEMMYCLVTPWAISTKFQLYKNRLIGCVANYIYPLYCRCRPVKAERKCTHICDKDVVVSLTSFPPRIDKVYLCINSLLRQSMPADKVILWLANSQFPEKSSLPNNLLALEKKGLEIRFCDDLRSYKKIFYTAQEYQNSIIITTDDDTLYPETWIAGLISTYMQYPDCVCCYRAHEMVFRERKVAPYEDWISLSPNVKGPSMTLVPIGVGGVLYPPGYFLNVDFDFDVISRLCPSADDLWLKAIGVKNGYKAVKVEENSKEWFTLKKTQDVALMHINTEGKVLNDVAINNLIDYYDLSISLGDSTCALKRRVGNAK